MRSVVVVGSAGMESNLAEQGIHMKPAGEERKQRGYGRHVRIEPVGGENHVVQLTVQQ